VLADHRGELDLFDQYLALVALGFMGFFLQ